MKTGIILVAALLFCDVLLSQNECKRDSMFYATAYNYIVNESGKKLWISDSVYDLDGVFFYVDLKDYPEIVEKLRKDLINSNFKMFVPYYSACIASIPHLRCYSTANHIVFFSPIKDSVLIANVCSLRIREPAKYYKVKKTELDYKTLNRFTTIREYLFIFNKDNTIRAAFSKDVIKD